MNFTADIEKSVNKIKGKYTTTQLYALLAVMVVGLVAHGYVIFNRISYHDNTACLFSLGATYELGRWVLGLIYDLQIYTTRTYSVPVFNGILSMIFIGLGAMRLVKIFDIKSKATAVAIGAIMIVHPVVPSIFSFMFTSWPYFLGLYLSIVSADIMVTKSSKVSIIVSILVLAISLGLYQAFFAVTISIFLIKLLQDTYTGKIGSVVAYAKSGFWYLLDLAAGLVVWSLIAAAFKKFKHIDTMQYKGMGEGYDISKFPSKVALSFKEFFFASYAGVNGLKFLRLLTLCVILAAVIHIAILIIKGAKNLPVKIAAAVGVVLLPLGMNVMYILSTSDEYYVDSLMVYGTAFVLILPVILIESLENVDIKNTLIEKCVKVITWLQILAIFVITISYVYLDNAAYMKADIAEQQATSYFTQLAANIKACDGFKDDMEIILVDFNKNQDGTFVVVDDNEELAAIKIDKFPVYSDLVTYGSAINFMQEHCGFGNELVSIDDGTMASNSEVSKMPCYPDDGSIAVVDDKVVVKFGD